MRNGRPMVDTNILVYAHNQDSPLFNQAETLLADLLDRGGFNVTKLVLFEFFSVMTNGRKVEAPLSPETAWDIINDMLETSLITVLQQDSSASFFLWLKKYISTTKRYQIYDASIAYEMDQHSIRDLYTRNIKDFKKFDFIRAINPFEASARGSQGQDSNIPDPKDDQKEKNAVK